jgi:cation:H+ antiporter
MYLLSLGGFVLLFGGGEWLVRGAVIVARRFGISPLLIGMTVVAFCTSAPELMVSVSAALEGRAAISVGNVVGSNIANILLILGASSLVAPIVFKPAELRRDTAVMLGSTVLLVALALTGDIGRASGALMVFLLLLYIVYSYRSEAAGLSPAAELHEHEAEEFDSTPQQMWRGVFYLAGGLGALVLGSRWLIDGASAIAETFGVPEAVVGLTIVAVGTSLPELATSLVAAVRGHSDVAVGNVVGSNIFNVLSILGITAIITPIPVVEQIARFDVWVMLGATVLLVPFLVRSGRIGRRAGMVSLALYIGYTATLYLGIAG